MSYIIRKMFLLSTILLSLSLVACGGDPKIEPKAQLVGEWQRKFEPIETEQFESYSFKENGSCEIRSNDGSSLGEFVNYRKYELSENKKEIRLYLYIPELDKVGNQTEHYYITNLTQNSMAWENASIDDGNEANKKFVRITISD